MRKLIGVMTILAALAIAGPAGAATRTVNIFASGFSPKSVTITEGDTVTWTNKDANANHQVLASKGEFVSPILHHELELLLHVQGRRDVQLLGRVAPEADRDDHGQGAAAHRHARRVRADHHGGREGDA